MTQDVFEKAKYLKLINSLNSANASKSMMDECSESLQSQNVNIRTQIDEGFDRQFELPLIALVCCKCGRILPPHTLVCPCGNKRGRNDKGETDDCR